MATTNLPISALKTKTRGWLRAGLWILALGLASLVFAGLRIGGVILWDDPTLLVVCSLTDCRAFRCAFAHASPEQRLAEVFFHDCRYDIVVRLGLRTVVLPSSKHLGACGTRKFRPSLSGSGVLGILSSSSCGDEYHASAISSADVLGLLQVGIDLRHARARVCSSFPFPGVLLRMGREACNCGASAGCLFSDRSFS